MFYSCFFFFNAPPTTEIYTLSLHDALPILDDDIERAVDLARDRGPGQSAQRAQSRQPGRRSEEHTSELQSLTNLVCRLLLEKKKKQKKRTPRKANERQTKLNRSIDTQTNTT